MITILILRKIICDDDEFIINKLHKYIRSYFEHIHLKCPEITSFTNGEALLADSGDKDILFLDIEMPGMNGIYIGNEIKKRNKDTIIFIITSFSEYLDEAILQQPKFQLKPNKEFISYQYLLLL